MCMQYATGINTPQLPALSSDGYGGDMTGLPLVASPTGRRQACSHPHPQNTDPLASNLEHSLCFPCHAGQCPIANTTWVSAAVAACSSGSKQQQSVTTRLRWGPHALFSNNTQNQPLMVSYCPLAAWLQRCGDVCKSTLPPEQQQHIFLLPSTNPKVSSGSGSEGYPGMARTLVHCIVIGLKGSYCPTTC